MAISNTPQKDWYLVYTKPKQELTAKINLMRQGYSVYLPMISLKKRVCGKSMDCVEVMFPRYLFIQLGKGVDNWSPIRSTIGVSHLVKFGLEQVSVPNTLISGLVGSENDAGVIEIAQTGVKAGDTCRIVDGAMQGYEGIVLARSGKERVKLMLKSINSVFDQLDISEAYL
ncbi:MAG: transcription termination/antitermination NusG family protein, partial [Gammaproteobacteria bacterium]|nr:transcription termination/antitermination NusG family protein [Gammaproteobacteria bacterium]